LHFKDESGITNYQSITVTVTNLTATGLKSYSNGAVYAKTTGHSIVITGSIFTSNYGQAGPADISLEDIPAFTLSSTTITGFSVSSTAYTQSITIGLSTSSTTTPIFSSLTLQCNDDSDYDATTYKAIVDSGSSALTYSAPIKLTSSSLTTTSCTFKN